MSTVEQMEGQIAELRRQITIQRDQNAARNRLLDLLGMCWCDGGCTKGMHRFYEGEPTAADIAALQVNAARARAWFVNRAFRSADHHPTAARIAHAAIDAAMPRRTARARSSQPPRTTCCIRLGTVRVSARGPASAASPSAVKWRPTRRTSASYRGLSDKRKGMHTWLTT